jgi:hypothetical protein
MTTTAETAGARRPRSQPRKEAEPMEPVREGRTATVNLPFVTAQFRVPNVPMPSVPIPSVSARDVLFAANAAKSYLPSPPRLAYYAGLGLAAAFEVIEWPVAVAIGAGTVVAGRDRRDADVERVLSSRTAPEQRTAADQRTAPEQRTAAEEQ